jgi:hypothetical protein
MKIINIKAGGIWLEPSWAVAGTRGSFGSCKICFEFSPEWDGMEKRATFFPADGSDAVEVILHNDEVLLPDEVMMHAGSADFVVDGVTAMGERLVSQKGELRIVDTAEPGGRSPISHTPNIIEQLRSEIAYLRSEIDRLKEKKDGIEVF